MKKYITLLLLPLLFACSDDDNVSDGNLTITEKGSIYNRTSLNNNGMYDNRFYATVINYSTQDVTGYVKFTIKDYGTLNSETGIVPSAKGYEKTFFISVETKEIIDESYLLNAEFVRE